MEEVDTKTNVSDLQNAVSPQVTSPLQESKLPYPPAALEKPKESQKFPWEESLDVSFNRRSNKEEQMKKKLGGVISLSDLTKDKT